MKQINGGLMNKKLSFNLIFLAICFMLSVFYSYSAFRLSFESFRSPGPGFIPRIVGVGAAILSAGLFVSDYLKGARNEAEVDSPLTIFLYLACFCVYAMIFEPLGYVLSTVIFAFALSSIMKNRIWVSALIGIGTGVALYFIFNLLAVPLPKGILG